MNDGNKTAVRTLGYIKKYWYLIMLSSLAGVVKIAIPMILPQVIRFFTDTVLVANSIFTAQEKIVLICKWFLILLCLYVFVMAPAAYFRQVCALTVSNRVMHTIRCQLYDKLQQMSSSFHDKYKSGAIVTRLNNDVEMIHEFIWSIVTNVWIDAAMLIILIALMGRINIFLTVISIIVLPVSTMATKHIRMSITRSSKKSQDEISEMSAFVQERMTGYSVVKLFGNSWIESKLFRKYSGNLLLYRMRTFKMFSLGEAAISIFSEVITALIVCLSAIIIVREHMTIGDMIIFYSYLGYFTTPLRRFAEMNVAYARSIAGIERVYEILDMEPDVTDAACAVQFDSLRPMDICFNHVSFRYEGNDRNTINDLSLCITSDTKAAIVGTSGCGKSTLVNLLLRFYEVDSGDICVAGRSIRDYKLESYYKSVGCVFQDTILFGESILENIAYGKENATFEEIVEAAKAANAYDFIMNLENKFDTVLGEKGCGISGGQKQRIAIARVFLKKPQLLIFDEATSALDSESECLVKNAMDRLLKGRTSIVIAHRLATIINSDMIVVMDKGEVIAKGKHEDLMVGCKKYRGMYDRQFVEERDNIGF